MSRAMLVSKIMTALGERIIAGGQSLENDLNLSVILGLRQDQIIKVLEHASKPMPDGTLLAPLDKHHEVWAAGVTYLRSRSEREAESTVADVYARVYEADRPELFFKSTGGRTTPSGGPIRIRRDSDWNVPEPELVLVINRHGEIVGYTAGNDVSSRSIEGENPLYLPQAKCYTGSCAIGSSIKFCSADEMRDLPITLTIHRGGEVVFHGETRTSSMNRTYEDLVSYLTREMDFHHGVFLMTGTGIVPAYPFSLMAGDRVDISVGEISLSNTVAPE
ncbi:MAG TPA: fumarylacetoacetate hydrolase family protein [Fimbriimonas sp.]|nr:fumarylacetoacetate hydrolase family protein [Fimbriimonas sp.]